MKVGKRWECDVADLWLVAEVPRYVTVENKGRAERKSVDIRIPFMPGMVEGCHHWDVFIP